MRPHRWNRRTSVAQIFIDTPYFSWTTTAVCMKNPLYDVIIGNIPGATHPASAVQTRSQVKATKGQSPLITPLIDLGSEDVTTLQEEDSTLQRALTAAKDKSDPQFQIQRGFLYRMKVNKQGQTTRTACTPRWTSPTCHDTSSCRCYERSSRRPPYSRTSH